MIGRAVRDRAVRSLGLALAIALAAGCEPYRVEYRRRPSFHQDANGGALPSRVTLPDGTVIVYDDAPPKGATGVLDGLFGTSNEPKANVEAFQMREETDDGEIILRALLPEHVIANTLTCIRNEEYELLWDQMLASRMKQEYDIRGEGVEEFTAYFTANRRELARTLNRMLFGMGREDVEIAQLEGHIMRCRLRDRVASDFRFTTIYCEPEGWGLRLLTIR